MKRTTGCILTGLALALMLSGCRVHVDKDAQGGDKNVRVDTPFGGVHVNTDQTTATDLGLPVYPGAQLAKQDGEHKSADVRMGFGEWQLRVQAVSYESADGQQKVVDFYKKALSKYGDVVTCQGKTALGQPAQTRDGLGCEEDKNGKINLNSGGVEIGKGYELKAGSKRHQHIVGFESAEPGKTRFSLVSIELPEKMSGKTESN